MSDPTGVLSPLLLAALAGPTPLVDPWVGHAGLAATGLLAMGFRNLIGGGGDDEAGSGVAGDEDFLEGGDFGAGLDDDDVEGFDDGLGGDDDDPLAEVEPRLSDLEADIEELSQTVSSIHGEHEGMRDSVQEIEDNVRKLLEVYEVVTQGANPFADGPSGPAAAGGGGTFGLLAGEGEDAAGVEEDSIAAEDPDDDGGLFDDLEDAADDGSEEEATDDEPEDDEGLSFEDLKSEFEFPEEHADEEDRLLGDVDPADLEYEPVRAEAPSAADRSASRRGRDASGKPYLLELPDGYGAELLVMEWLDYLVSESSVPDAMRAIKYYGTVDWIAEDVAVELQSVLTNVTAPAGRAAAADGGLPTELTVEHHTRSLEFVARLAELEGGPGGPRGSPNETLAGISLGRRDHGVQR